MVWRDSLPAEEPSWFASLPVVAGAVWTWELHGKYSAVLRDRATRKVLVDLEPFCWRSKADT